MEVQWNKNIIHALQGEWIVMQRELTPKLLHIIDPK